jgi:RNA polymerase sigma-70 factor (ECF subfamily)
MQNQAASLQEEVRIMPPIQSNRSPNKKQWLEDLAQRLIHLDRQSFDDLFAHFVPRFRKLFLDMGLPEFEAEDLAINCVEDIACNIHKYKKQGNFAAFAFAVAHNAGVDWLRKRPRTEPLDENYASANEDASTDFPEGRMETYLALHDAVNKLQSEIDRRIIQLHYFAPQHPLKEIADIFGISYPTARVYHGRARRRLEKILVKDVRIAKDYRIRKLQ